MSFFVSDEHLIPVEDGQAVYEGWSATTDHRPLGVTWHWTATWDIAECDRLLGGADAERKGVASAHYCVGRTFAEGVHRYVTLANRSWHAGKNQTLRFDGQRLSDARFRGLHTTIGVETVDVGYARAGVPSAPDWLAAADPSGRWQMRIQPWTEEQALMMIAVGREIVTRWPHIGPRHHHGHHDLCPTYKVDVAGFPFAQVLRGIYDDPSIPDVWSPLWTVKERQRALRALGFDLGAAGVDGRWGERSTAALRQLQREHGLVEDAMWTTFVSWKVYELLAARGLELVGVTAAPRPAPPR